MSAGRWGIWIGWRVLGLVWLGLLVGVGNQAEAQEVLNSDPSGRWKGPIGELSLMLTGDCLSFVYSAVFGSTAHLCDGAGVAGLETDNEYHYVDDQGIVAFVVRETSVTMRSVQGIASFCGAYWPGEEFSRHGFEAPRKARVTATKAYFSAVGARPPQQRPAYVIKGDQVEVVPAGFEGRNEWVLARFQGKKSTTVGLLRKSALGNPK